MGLHGASCPLAAVRCKPAPADPTRLNQWFACSQVWDLRTHRCLQTITQDDWKKTEDLEAKPYCLMYDNFHRWA